MVAPGLVTSGAPAAPAGAAPAPTVDVIDLAAGAAAAAWDAYVAARADGAPYHTTAWQRTVARAYGHRAWPLLATRGGAACGVLPLTLVRSRLFGTVLATSPYASLGAVLADDAATARALVERAVELARELRVRQLELKSVRRTAHPALHAHEEFCNYTLALDEPDRLWTARLRGNARTAVRKGEKAGLTVERGTHLLDAFYELVALNMRRLGTPVHARRFYAAILAEFGARADLVVAREAGRAAAALLELRHGDAVYVYAAASDPTRLAAQPNNFVYWRAIRDAWATGARVFDFGRSPVGSGPARFKEGWGAVAQPLYYEYWLPGGGAVPTSPQRNRAFGLAAEAWRRLPLPLTRALGPHLIRSIP
jgi:FemAB-related protein (PEP-CTERM system-associated)